jgi:hypothetical protein
MNQDGAAKDSPLSCDRVPPPVPPVATTVWERASRVQQLPRPQIEINPGAHGLAQLPTWFWLGNDASGVDLTVGVPGGIDGYAVTLRAHPVAYDWTFGDGQTAVSYTAGSAGSGASASATHTYLDNGTFPVGVTVTWAGSYTFTGYGVTETVPLGPVRQPETVQPYVVQQIRSVLVGGGAQ